MAIKKYTNGSWTPACRKYGTETDTITTLPATIIGDGTPITSYIIKGNMEQNGTPTPSNPIYPSECGDLVTSGEHAGQYKLPLTLGSTTTDIYLGEVQSTRRIKKLVLDGTEDWQLSQGWKKTSTSVFYFFSSDIINIFGSTTKIFVLSDRFESASRDSLYGGDSDMIARTGENAITIRVSDSIATTAADFKAFLAQQYANGTPVTVWYVLAEPETAVVNEPLRKIGDYVDSVSGTGLATSGTAQEFDVETALKPSKVDMTYHGWHEHEDTKYST